jgi:hypothetical protein
VDHPFDRVVAQIIDSELVTRDEIVNLQNLVGILCSPIVNLQKTLETHPNTQLAAAYFSNKFKAIHTDLQRQLEDIYYAIYRDLRHNPDGRFSEKHVESQLNINPKYRDLLSRSDKIKYFSDQLTDLYSAYLARGRVLDQYSNNYRRLSKEETD